MYICVYIYIYIYILKLVFAEEYQTMLWKNLNGLIKRVIPVIFAPTFFSCFASSICARMRLGPIKGYNEMVNDIVYAKPAVPSASVDVLVFFPGDIQVRN